MNSPATTGRLVSLVDPVRVEGWSYAKLFVHPPSRRDLRRALACLDDEDVGRLLAARLCRCPLDVIRLLTPADAERVMDAVEPLLRAAPPPPLD